jgi:hypothetical protein
MFKDTFKAYIHPAGQQVSRLLGITVHYRVHKIPPHVFCASGSLIMCFFNEVIDGV